MRIEQIDAYVVKLPRPNIAENIPDYVRPRKSLSYDTTPPIDDMAAARYAEALFVKITADNGLVGWGEGQSLLVPEATKAVVDRLFAPHSHRRKSARSRKALRHDLWHHARSRLPLGLSRGRPCGHQQRPLGSFGQSPRRTLLRPPRWPLPRQSAYLQQYSGSHARSRC